ncbi:DUF1707 SHOCT-like domain-containing protein [Phytohabitans rumicis]|uniref:DUF1707 domain-containing protein n=1 Tax=Phytohabitans rumicis TaxID=1076125 RepID=A0A6V8L1J8_9ACTN|nr:DUF1707 domain-containing protein [Phytohabitans rumicis]GFJ88499.1 hypothetical protein Prum_021410 [Phytohabitans rumicis]
MSLQDLPPARLALRIGTPEIRAAEQALRTHVAENRIDSAEFERRMETAKVAKTQAELLRVFADLPAPHPELPEPPPPLPLRKVGSGGDDMPLYGVACILAMLFGLPVAVVLGFTDDAWWALAVPVAFCVLLVVIIDLIERFRGR